MFSCAHLSRYVLLITQAGGVGVLSSDTVHGVVHLRSCPAVHLERRGHPLKRVSLDPAAKQNKKKYHLEDLLFPVLLFFVHLWQFNSNLTMNDENHRVLAIFPYLKFCFPVVLEDFGLLLPDHILNVKERVFT